MLKYVKKKKKKVLPNAYDGVCEKVNMMASIEVLVFDGLIVNS